MTEPRPEPWLRGALDGVDPLLAPVIHALMQAREDLRAWTEGLSTEQVWSQPWGLTSLGFHLRHIAGSLDRLSGYLQAREITEEQLRFLRAEEDAGPSLDELVAGCERAIDLVSEVVRALPVESLREARGVGRKRLPTTVMGLAVHLAEHTQRHVGECIVLCKLLRAL